MMVNFNPPGSLRGYRMHTMHTSILLFGSPPMGEAERASVSVLFPWVSYIGL